MAIINQKNSSSSRLEVMAQQAIFWIRENQEQFWGIVGMAVLVVAMSIFIYHHHVQESDSAWNALGPVQSQILQGQSATAQKGLSDWMTRYGSTSASSYAKFLQADLLYKTSDYANAAMTYGDLVAHASPSVLRPLALSGQAAAEEMAGHIPQALALTQKFSEIYPDHYLAGSMILSQARLDEIAGNKAAASALYERFTLLYPQASETPFAKARNQAIAGTLPAAPTAPALSK